MAAHMLLAAAAAAAMPPNFVILFLDDHGWGDVGCNTNGSVTETPHIDALAAEGLRFTDFHAGFSVCTASRGALLTGRTCPRTGVCGNFGPSAQYGMALQERTVADLLKTAPTPYATHMLGKWHLGHHEPYSPTYRGFDDWMGLPFSGDMGCLDSTPQGCRSSYDRTVGNPACPALCSLLPAHSTVVGIPRYDSAAANCTGHPCNDDIVEQPFEPKALNARYAARATSIIEEHAASDHPTPFLLYMAFAHTHTPLAYDETRFGNASSRPGRAQIYGNTLAEVDDAVGQIVRAVDAAGLAQSTLILLTADNGPADLGVVPCENIGSQGPFEGAWQKSRHGGGGGGTAKTTVWEGGHRTVGLARWPGTVRPGVSGALVSTLDFVPTLAKLAGAELPTDRVYDGVDLGPLLRGEKGAAGHSTLVHPIGEGTYPLGVPAMRLGRYKAFIETEGSDSCFLPDGTHRTGRGGKMRHDPPLIFDVEADPAESTPLDPDTIPEVVQSIRAAFAEYWHSVNTTLRSATDYGGSPQYRPCGNTSAPACRTHHEEQPALP
eukprot:TRINITY_DN30436_c0_g1_i1.p1 TRINITY_DN30436_c0_g1~~TRINITY_DN30436_c0_g1_i1.p1  ORF type:complete len:549 (+),score=163.06 TRINITY_DN30436_c0_g1_i1:35-1681(+)